MRNRWRDVAVPKKKRKVVAPRLSRTFTLHMARGVGGAPVAALAAVLVLTCCRAHAAVDERQAEALALAAEEAVRKYRATTVTTTTTTGGQLSRLQNTFDVDGGGDPSRLPRVKASTTTATTTMAPTEKTATASGSKLRGGTGAFDAAQVRVLPRGVPPPTRDGMGGDALGHRFKWAVLETTTPCELKRYPGVRQFLDHRIHLYRHRVRVQWGGGDPRMILADGKTFVGVAPLGRMRAMEDVEALLKVSEGVRGE